MNNLRIFFQKILNNNNLFTNNYLLQHEITHVNKPLTLQQWCTDKLNSWQLKQIFLIERISL